MYSDGVRLGSPVGHFFVNFECFVLRKLYGFPWQLGGRMLLPSLLVGIESGLSAFLADLAPGKRFSFIIGPGDIFQKCG